MQVVVSIPTQSVGTGTYDDQVMIQLHADASAWATHASPLRGFQFDIRFEPKRLSVVEATPGGFFEVQGYQNYWLSPRMAVGTLRLGAVALDVPSPSTSTVLSTLLAQVPFHVKGDLSTAIRSIYLENIQLAAPDGRAILATARHSVGARPDLPFAAHHLQNALFQNYPNPFNPETWIPYELAEGAVVTIHIYNAQGHRIRSLELGFHPAGVYQTQTDAAYWDGRTEKGEPVSSGLYYYTIHAGDFTATRKMLVVK